MRAAAPCAHPDHRGYAVRYRRPGPLGKGLNPANDFGGVSVPIGAERAAHLGENQCAADMGGVRGSSATLKGCRTDLIFGATMLEQAGARPEAVILPQQVPWPPLLTGSRLSGT